MSTTFTIALQAGGESRRMGGSDKALLPFLGRTLIERVLERVAPLGGDLLITTNHPEALAFLGLPCFPDVLPGRGALGGLYTALSAARGERVAVVACDMPFANPDLLRALDEALEAAKADAALPRSAEGYEPFHAVYRRQTCLPAVEAALAAGEKRLISWLPAVRPVIFTPEAIARYDPQGLAFINANTPEELATAEALARQAQPPDRAS